MRTVTIKIDEYLLELLDKYALEHGLSRSEAIRRAISTLLAKEREERVPAPKIEKFKLL